MASSEIVVKIEALDEALTEIIRALTELTSRLERIETALHNYDATFDESLDRT